MQLPKPPENLLKPPESDGVHPHLLTSSPPSYRGGGQEGKDGDQEVDKRRRSLDTRISHKFQPSTCPRCSEITLHGMVAEGYLAHLDPTPLDDASEARALVAGRVTWHMTTDREVTWRTSTKITYRPAGNHRDYAVFAEHRCHQPIATSIDDWAWSTRPSTTEEPQF